MDKIKKISALALVFVMIFCFTACHKKDEIAVKIGDVEFTSAYYMCALISSDSEAKAEVEEQLSEDESTDDIDYYSLKIDGKKFVDWVEDRTIEKLKAVAYYKTLCKENGLELDEETVEQTESYISIYWNNYGYSQLFEPNGVSQQTFLQFNLDNEYSSLYFNFLYGKGGEKEIAEDALKTQLTDTFICADVLTVIFSEQTEEEMQAIKTKLEGYEADLKNNRKTFEEVYIDYNGSEKEDSSSDTEETKPSDKYATILGPEDSKFNFDYYDDVKEMAIGDVKLIEQENSGGYYLVVKKDISSDPYYLEYLDEDLRQIVGEEEFETETKAEYTKLEADIDKSAVSQFKVKKIKFPE